MGRPEPGPGAEATRFERVISGEGWIVAAALAAAVLLAWVWLWLAPPGAADMAGMAMMPATPVEPWRAAYLAAAFAMWTLMMVAMMLPSAAPMILLYSRFARKAVPSPFAYLAAFVLAYLAVWTLFSALAATAQAGLVAAGLVPAMTLALGNVRLAGALLLLAGLYQLSPLKRACDTCMLAGLGAWAQVDPNLVEWDYGVAEGKRTDEMRRTIPGWSVWTHPIVGGESLEQVGHRADKVLARVAGEDRLVVLFAHAHILRILTARWLGLDAGLGSAFALDPASVSILGHERETHVIERWNFVTTGDLERFIGTG